MTATEQPCSCCGVVNLLRLEDGILICVSCDRLALWPDRTAGR